MVKTPYFVEIIKSGFCIKENKVGKFRGGGRRNFRSRSKMVEAAGWLSMKALPKIAVIVLTVGA